MKTIQLGKKFAVLISALILTSAALGSMLTQMYFPQLGKIAGQLEDPLEAWSEASYVVWQYNSTYYACRNMSTNIVNYFGTSDDAAIQWGVDRCTLHGGSVYVKAPTYTGTYSASVTLKDNVTLILDKGARGITVTIDSGADSTLVDYENGYRKEWVAGVLYTFMDLRTGKLWWQGQNRTDTLAFPEQTASYIVFQDGSLTKMKNGTTGQIDASNTNASNIWNWAIANTSVNGGGVVFGRVGLYDNISPSIIAKENVTIQGEGWSTIFKAADNLNASVFYSTSSSTLQKGIVIRDLAIDGNKANQGTPNTITPCGIMLQDVSYFLVDNVYVYNVRQFGFWSRSVSSSINEGGIVQNSRFENCSWNGISIGSFSHRVKVLHNYVKDFSDVGITVTNNKGTIVANNQVVLSTALAEGGVNSYWCIGTEGASNATLIEGNVIDVSAVSGIQSSGIEVDGTGGKTNEVIGNVIYGGSTLHYGIDIYTSNTLVESNHIYNVGDASGCAINIRATADYSKITSNYVNTVGYYFVWVRAETTDVEILNNYFKNSGAVAIYIAGAGSDRCKIIGNHIESWGNNIPAIWFGQTGDARNNYGVIKDNYLYDSTSGRRGIFVHGDYNEIVGNTIRIGTGANDNGTIIHGETGYGSDYCQVRGNFFVSCNAAIVIVHSTCNNTFVDGNYMDLATDDVLNYGTATLWGDNVDVNGIWDSGVEP